jgi:1-aminocyclopropane-1-carboxylate deaminase/D-cysteine desulfhydrase-like pyridoxal-dependent ACC family enzyme
VLLDRGGAGQAVDGNLLLDRLFGASIRHVSVSPNVKTLELAGVSEHVERAAEEERGRGRQPYIAPIGGSLLEGSMREPWGAIGYVDAFLELLSQASSLGKRIDAVVHATGSGSTQAGLLAGALACSPHTRIVGISVSEGRETMARRVRRMADSTLELLGLEARTQEEDVIVLDDYLEAGYGVFTPAVGAAIERMARAEGVLLDPVYTGKALVGLLDLLAQGFFEEKATIVFLHSGGTPALFPHREAIAAHLA